MKIGGGVGNRGEYWRAGEVGEEVFKILLVVSRQSLGNGCPGDVVFDLESVELQDCLN